MSTVGCKTDSEFRVLFQDLFDRLSKKVEKNNDKTCYWVNCYNDNEFDSSELLMKHIKELHLANFTENCDVAPTDRHNLCGTFGCEKVLKKKKLLLNHLRTILEVNQTCYSLHQAKALNVLSRQMQLHPLIIKWCLKYADLIVGDFLN